MTKVTFTRSDDIYADGQHVGYFSYSASRWYINSFKTMGGSRIARYGTEVICTVYCSDGESKELSQFFSKSHVKQFLRVYFGGGRGIPPIKIHVVREHSLFRHIDFFTDKPPVIRDSLLEWIGQNLSATPFFKRVGSTSTGGYWNIYFASEEDAMIFKMKWL
jgi:hypothetical protein